MSNFAFLQTEWPLVFEAARRAGASAHADARAACFYARRALELAVTWLYTHDKTFKLPYQDNLNALIYEPSFRTGVGDALFTKARLIKDLGNQTVRGRLHWVNLRGGGAYESLAAAVLSMPDSEGILADDIARLLAMPSPGGESDPYSEAGACRRSSVGRRLRVLVKPLGPDRAADRQNEELSPVPSHVRNGAPVWCDCASSPPVPAPAGQPPALQRPPRLRRSWRCVAALVGGRGDSPSGPGPALATGRLRQPAGSASGSYTPPLFSA